MRSTDASPRLTAQQIVAELGGRLIGESSVQVAAVAPLSEAQYLQATFIVSAKWRANLQSSQASVLLCRQADYDFCLEQGAGQFAAYIICDDPYVYFARLSSWLQHLKQGEPRWGYRHPTAQVDATATIAPTAILESHVVIGAGVHLAEHVWVGAGSVIGDNVSIGTKTRLYPRVTIYQDCQVGARNIIHSGAVIGADGFGFAPHNKTWIKIPQTGRVTLGDDVEVGANTTIDRGALQDTVIEEGVKIDNLVMIAHNVRIGAHTVIAANTGIAGSTKIGRHCQIAGACNIVGHIQIADDCVITGNTTVTHSIHEAGGIYAGIFPFDKMSEWERNAPVIRQLRRMRDRLRMLEKQQPKETE
ncbi:UDP-3-O-(3-hydroxymyristoyl)glucosamine N-acyltransferase [Parvibium lacunae]|uniref:UDP-3-O-acylglucosamine N-acyltransferase n=1 Tax=Parvibium lacunae TaxID=1888893 RepID=A0A368L8J0_9BURK|nr:UDP-3-O-(3-hydroxymyristoyl)glucosamine N-acyltransferase [Parvibium lacunae]